MNKNVTVICDLQFGSTGKGLIAGYLAKKEKPDVVVTAWSANAGHTYIDGDGREFVHCMLANGVVSPNLKYVLIGPDSQLCLKTLERELQQCADLLVGVEVLIHPHACVISPKHVEEEAGPMTKIGSTKKGCGAAVIDKIRRNPEDNPTMRNYFGAFGECFSGYRVCTPEEYNRVIDQAERIQVEGAQGYSLGINSGFYPYVTSRECTPQQIMSDCLIPLKKLGRVVGCARTFPIRVANRFDEEGNMVGYSGPCYPDQKEMSWKDVGQAPEFTTVTKLQRRVFTFSKQQMRDAIRACGVDEIFLNFCNYLRPTNNIYDEGSEVDDLIDIINFIGQDIGGAKVRYLGYGPAVDNVGEI
jgi:adenylosuccinate synthase